MLFSLLKMGDVQMPNQVVVVQATQAWFDTGITVQENSAITISFQTGAWTADPQTNQHQLYGPAGDAQIIIPPTQPLYPLVGAPMGALVGRIGGNPVFLVGAGPTQIPSGQSGQLSLCINDDIHAAYGPGLADNQGQITVLIYNTNTQANLTNPLISEPAQTSPAAPMQSLGPLEFLVGTWTNKLTDTDDLPYSYNVMPLPQVDPSSPTGYILKNFAYYEELTFSAIHGSAANRGGKGTQNCNVLFYEQRVYFAEGPNKNALVHAENGSLLFLNDQLQILGPYGNGDLPGLGNQTIKNSVAPTQQFNIIKQISVPHGNSILAAGSYQKQTGAPIIPVISTLPDGVNTQQYLQLDPVSNPNPSYTLNPNQALADALLAKPVSSFIAINVSSDNGSGGVTNIGFEQQHAKVVTYSCNYWLEALSDATEFTQLQYSQTILMRLPIGEGFVDFPHVTTNTLTKV
jgi:hypothetical protein